MATYDSSSPNGLSQPRRIMLWTTPRSLSTIFCQCVSFVPGMRMYLEPFFAAHVFGPECLAVDKDSRYDKQVFQHYSEEKKGTLFDDCSNWFSADMCTYDWVKSQLEISSFLDTDVVFCKDFATGVTNHYDKIPEGFQHIFLIRNPYKVLPSYKRWCVNTVLQEDNVDDFKHRDIPARIRGGKTCGFQDILDLFSYLKKHRHANPVIIDADDLQNHTSSILRKLLEDTIGVPYNDSFLTWDKDVTRSKQWVMAKAFGYNSVAQAAGAHSKAFTSTRIEPAKEAPSRKSLTPDLIEVIDAAMPIYEKLYEMRLKPT